MVRGGYFYSADITPSRSDLSCLYKWTVTNGIISENNSSTITFGSSITVIWDNTTESGQIKVELVDCNLYEYEGKSTSESYPILSINNTSPQPIIGLSAVPFNSVSQTYSIPKLVYPNRGTGDLDNLSVDSYKWLIPQGWKFSNGHVSNGIDPVSNLTEKIAVIPNTTTGGVIKVWGHSNCGRGYDSYPSSLSISRVFPATIDIEVSTTNNLLQGNKAPITLSVPNWPYAQYSWTKPQTWVFQGSSTSASVTLIPDGCKGGTVKCQITIQATNQTTSIQKIFSDFKQYPDNQIPTISGSNYLCANQLYSIENLPNLTTSISWSINSLANISSGQGTQSVFISRAGNNAGAASLGVTMSVGGCASFPIEPKNLWVSRPPSNPTIHIPIEPINCKYEAMVWAEATPNDVNYIWQTNAEIISQDGSELLVKANCPQINKTSYLTLQTKAINKCGESEYTKRDVLVISGKLVNPTIVITPNPATNQININFTQDSPENTQLTKSLNSKSSNYELTIFNFSGMPVYKGKTNTTINVSGWHKGLYIIKVIKDKQVINSSFLIE